MKKTLGIIAMLLIVAMLSVVFVSCKPGPDAEQPEQPAPPAPPAEPVLEGTEKGTLQIELPTGEENAMVTHYLDGKTVEGQSYYLTVSANAEEAVEVTREKYDNNTFKFSIGEGESKKYINIVEVNTKTEEAPEYHTNLLYQSTTDNPNPASYTEVTEEGDKKGMLCVTLLTHKKESGVYVEKPDTVCYIGTGLNKQNKPYLNLSAKFPPKTFDPEKHFFATFVPAPEPDPAPETDPAPEV